VDSGLFWWLAICGAVGGLVAYFSTRQTGRNQNQELDEQKKKREEDEAARSATAVWLELKQSFPFLPTPFNENLTAENIYKAITDTLFSFPLLGFIADTILLAPALPSEERRRHLYIVGKTGMGKSTFMEKLIQEDLENHRGVGVIAPEGEFFRDRLLPQVPREREEETIYFAPGDPRNPLTFNPLMLEPGEDPIRAADDLFTILKRSFGDEELSSRMQPILHNALGLLVGQPGMTLWEVKRLLQDKAFRDEMVQKNSDEYIQEYWLETYPRYSKGADVPIINRLDQFLRPPLIRKILCHPKSSFSIRKALTEGQILFIDLFGLSEENRLLFGQMILSKFQLELMRRELAGGTHKPFYLYADEFQSFAGVAQVTWRELLSRGRKYGLALTLAHQFPAQLPTGLQAEIFGNVNSLVAFCLGAKDAGVIRHEFLEKKQKEDEERVEPIRAEELIELDTGEAYIKLAGGRAIKIRAGVPMAVNVGRANEVIAVSWEKYKAEPFERTKPALRPSQTVDLRRRKSEPPSPLREEELEVEAEEPVAPHAPEIKVKPVKKEIKPLPPIPQGRGGQQHQYLQEIIKRMGNDRNYKATIEKQILGGLGKVDVALERNGTSIACEISVTSTPEQELANIQKCLSAEFEHVILISADRETLTRVGELAKDSLAEKDQKKVAFLSPGDFFVFLEELDAKVGTKEETVRGYKVKVKYRRVDEADKKARKQAIMQTILEGLKRAKKHDK